METPTFSFLFSQPARSVCSRVCLCATGFCWNRKSPNILNLIRIILGGESFPCISLKDSLYRWGFLHLDGTWTCSRWWFQTFFIFTPIWGRLPIWLIFFKWGWNHQLADVLKKVAAVDYTQRIQTHSDRIGLMIFPSHPQRMIPPFGWLVKPFTLLASWLPPLLPALRLPQVPLLLRRAHQQLGDLLGCPAGT